MAKITESQLRSIIKQELNNTIKSQTLSEGLMQDMILKFLGLVAPNLVLKFLFYGIIGIRKTDPNEARRILLSADPRIRTKLYMLALEMPVDIADRDFITSTVVDGGVGDSLAGYTGKGLPDTSKMPPPSTDTIQESKRRR
jgi:hypothetical protein